MSKTIEPPMPCPFCYPDPAKVLHESPLAYALADIHPVTPDHVLVITRRHVASWFDATPEEQAALLAGADAARAWIESRGPVDGYNLGVNVGGAAGQTVPHLHLHVIPRRNGDVVDPRGGVRHVIPERGNYLRVREEAEEAAEDAPTYGDAPPPPGPAVVGGPDGPLLRSLIDHLDRAWRADLVVAFVLNSGIDALEGALRNFLSRGGQLRLVTGDYLGVTDPHALRRLLNLRSQVESRGDEAAGPRGSLELRVHECRGSSFHPKAYLFHLDRDPTSDLNGIAYVGSSNLTRTALHEGIEWNYRLVLGRDRAGFQRVVEAFERAFHGPDTQPLTGEWIDAYTRRRPERPIGDTPPPPAEALPPPPEPHAIQEDALAALEATRAEGYGAGLVVMATGLGKTWLAAFDVARRQAAVPGRTLFVAHREEILTQAMATFQRILPGANLGLYTGKEKAPDADVLFASIQSLGRHAHLDRFAPDVFRTIVVDEFHHAAAATYRRLIDHFVPDFLLGLTATPERTDGGDLLALCDENLVFRCDLFEALRRAPDRLVPFHYFGIPDAVDYQNIPWRGRRFATEELTAAVATQERAENAYLEWSNRRGTRTLGFCCSQDHADFMAEHFRSRGVRAVALHAGETSAPRQSSLEDLAAGKLEVIFAVDILNEGVDLPDVDTVLMLRPTESRIVFLQQLGRGLRVAEGKSHLTVIDYIGNHRSFLLKVQTLLQLQPGDDPLRHTLSKLAAGETEDLRLPPGCEVTYELEAIRLLEAQLRAPNAAHTLQAWYRDFLERTGRRPTALDAFHEGRNPRSARQSHGSWLRFVAAQGDLDQEIVDLIRSTDLASSFLGELERTKMEKSYKMVVLLALLRHDQLPGGLHIDELASGFREIASRSHRIERELDLKPGESPSSLKSILRQSPLKAWSKPHHDRVYFEFEDGRFASCFTVPDSRRTEFASLVHELASWRLAEHLAGQATAGADSGTRIVCKILHTRGTPILKLPDRRVYPDVPTGELTVSVDGTPHTARFAKEYVNVVRGQGEERNALPEILRGWFGPDAGQPGTLALVAFTLTGDTWVMSPLAPGEASRVGFDRATERGPDQRMYRDDGSEVDATFHLENSEGQVSLVFHSAGGTARTAGAVNREYAAGLRLLLERLAAEGVLIVNMLLDTKQTRDWAYEDRILKLRGDRSYPLDLAAEQDLDDLRKAISAAQGSNPNRRIRLVLDESGRANKAPLAALLAGSSDSTGRRAADVP